MHTTTNDRRHGDRLVNQHSRQTSYGQMYFEMGNLRQQNGERETNQSLLNTAPPKTRDGEFSNPASSGGDKSTKVNAYGAP